MSELKRVFNALKEANVAADRLTLELNKLALAEFPAGCVAEFQGRYVIIPFGGVEGRTGRVNCQFENGNIWEKDIDLLRREPDPKKWPTWIREYKLLHGLPNRKTAIRDYQLEREGVSF